MINLKKLESEINYSFKNKDLLKKAVTHKSAEKIDNNEKLEFLGDRVLGLVLSKKIFLLYPNETEGDLDKRFSFLVNKKNCLNIANKLKLRNYLILGNTYKRKKQIEDKIIADACESLIGAIYLDGGFDLAKELILKLWKTEILKTRITRVDSKTKLQEYSLKISKKLPVYKILKTFGPKHKIIYSVSVKIINSNLFKGNGKSIKLAQQNAAQKLIKDIGI